MTADELFVATLDDLARRVDPAPPEYDVLMAAALLRKLLLDDSPLVHQVNRDRRLKLRYEVNIQEPTWKVAGSPAPVFWSAEDGFDPATALRSARAALLTHDQMLARTVMLVNGHEATVRDLIAQAAHVSGAVHLGEPKSDLEHALRDVAEQLEVGGYSAAVRPLQAIGRVVIRGLEPLRKQVEAGFAP